MLSVIISPLPHPDRRIDLQTDCGGAELDETSEHEPVSDSRLAAKRPVSMFEPRDSPYNSHHQHQQKVSSIPESRTTSSMYQMADQPPSQQQSTLPAGDEVKHRTDLVTRRIQELWTVVQDQVRDSFVPCAERIRVAIEELTVIFPTVR